MRNTRKWMGAALLAAATLAAGAITPAADAGTGTVLYTADLIAGQHEDVGDVVFEQNGNMLCITYRITDPDWTLDEIHAYVGARKPKKPSPGRFNVKDESPHPTLKTYTVDVTGLDCVWVAAHAVVVTDGEATGCDVDDLLLTLPDTCTVSVSYPGTNSYFVANVSNGGILDGSHDAWCANGSVQITPGTSYVADVYSTYETLPLGIVVQPGNLDLVNYLLNYDWQTAGYSRGDVQQAVWALLGGGGNDTSGPFTQANVDALVSLAQNNGEGWEPDCGEAAWVLIVPREANGTRRQPMLVGVTLDGGDETEARDETAWGFPNAGNLQVISFKQGWGKAFKLFLN